MSGVHHRIVTVAVVEEHMHAPSLPGQLMDGFAPLLLILAVPIVEPLSRRQVLLLPRLGVAAMKPHDRKIGRDGQNRRHRGLKPCGSSTTTYERPWRSRMSRVLFCRSSSIHPSPRISTAIGYGLLPRSCSRYATVSRFFLKPRRELKQRTTELALLREWLQGFSMDVPKNLLRFWRYCINVNALLIGLRSRQQISYVFRKPADLDVMVGQATVGF